MKTSYSDHNNIFCIGETIGEMVKPSMRW